MVHFAGTWPATQPSFRSYTILRIQPFRDVVVRTETGIVQGRINCEHIFKPARQIAGAGRQQNCPVVV